MSAGELNLADLGSRRCLVLPLDEGEVVGRLVAHMLGPTQRELLTREEAERVAVETAAVHPANTYAVLEVVGVTEARVATAFRLTPWKEGRP